MFRVRGEIPALFSGTDDKRYMFFTDGQTQYLDVIDNQSNGYFVEKWTNLTDAGATASNTADGGVNTDYPLFRLADVYLMMLWYVAERVVIKELYWDISINCKNVLMATTLIIKRKPT
mgnify:CR=1 FL=1